MDANHTVVATLAREQWQNWLIADLGGKIEASQGVKPSERSECFKRSATKGLKDQQQGT